MSQLNKPIVLAIGFLAAMSGILSAQAAEVTVGATVGLAQSRLDVDNWGDSDSYTSAEVGGFVSVELVSTLSLQAGLTYVQRGGEYTDRTNHPDGSLAYVDDASYTVSYLEIPVLLRYRPFTATRYTPVLIAGPVGRVALSSEMSWNGTDIDDWADGSDLAFAVGFGVESALGRFLGSVDVIYNRSFGGVGDGEDYAFGAALEGLGARFCIAF